MATKATVLDTLPCIPEVAKMYSSILFDLLVVLAMVFGMMPLGSPWRGSDWSAKQLGLGRRLDLGAADR